MGNIPALAAGKQAFRRLCLECELHSRKARVKSNRTHQSKRKEGRKGSLFFLVEVWRFELQASSTRRDVYMFFAHNYLHIVRIFRQNDPYLTNVSDVSVQKNSVDGQRCGRSLFLPQNRGTRNTPDLIKSVVPFWRFYCSIVL